MADRPRTSWSVGILAVALVAAASGWSAEYTVVPEESVFAIVTHRAGVASAMAHNHIVAASDYEASLTYEPEEPTRTAFTLRFSTEGLVADEPGIVERWSARIVALGILDEVPKTLGDSARADIRKSMLGDKQLDAERFPTISATLRDVREEETKVGDHAFGYLVTIALEVHGKTVEKRCPVSVTVQEDHLEIEGTGSYRFSDFGIEPYSAMLGAVRNEDEFDVYVRVVAKPKGSESPGPAQG